MRSIGANVTTMGHKAQCRPGIGERDVGMPPASKFRSRRGNREGKSGFTDGEKQGDSPDKSFRRGVSGETCSRKVRDRTTSNHQVLTALHDGCSRPIRFEGYAA